MIAAPQTGTDSLGNKPLPILQRPQGPRPVGMGQTSQQRTLANRQRAAMNARPMQGSPLPTTPGTPSSAGGFSPSPQPPASPQAAPPRALFPGGPLMPGQAGPAGGIMPGVGHIQPSVPTPQTGGGMASPGVPPSPGVPSPGVPAPAGVPGAARPAAVPPVAGEVVPPVRPPVRQATPPIFNGGPDPATLQRLAMGQK